MNRKIFALFALTAGMHLAVHASENVNTPENRQFLKQQENLSRQLREKPDHQLKAWAEKQVLENPLQRSDNHFLDELVRKQQASQDGKPRQGARKRAARTVLTGMCYSVGSATRQGSSSPTRFIGQSAMTSRT